VKKYIFIFLALILAGPVVFAQTQQKLGFVDSQVILNQFSEAIKAQGDLDALTNKWTVQLDSMNKDLQQMYSDYQKQANTMPEDKKLAQQQKIIEKQNAIDKFRQDKFAQQTGEIYKKQDEIFGPVKDKIYKAIAKVAKQENMQFVFDKSGDIILLYADPKYDITYKVLDVLKTAQ
jgi:outer membrane protein